MPSALLIGNSDGIGLALTRRLLDQGFVVAGVSRSASPIEHARYHHHVADVSAAGYGDALVRACHDLHDLHDLHARAGKDAGVDMDAGVDQGSLDTCIYCAGIGQELSLAHIEGERAVFAVNLMGMVRTVEHILPRMIAAGRGHIIGLSSLADRFCNPDAPSYGASKAGVSSYLEALALAVRPRGVHITNIRFGFVDTKMAKADMKPFQISPDQAADRVLRCMERRPIRYTYPRRMAALLWLVSWPNRIRLWLG